MSVNRRSFLVASVGSVVLGRFPAVAGTLHHLGEAAEIGREVLRVGAVEADERVLRRSLGLGASEPVSLDRSWRAAIREDFSAGRTLLVEGWVLSLTEARLCALAALSLPVA